MMTKTTPTRVVKIRLIEREMNFSTSERTFWSLPSVSSLRWSSKTEYGGYTLDDGVDVVILEILGDARYECHAHCHQQQRAGAFDERRGLVLAEPRRVIVDYVTEDERVEEREDLIRRRQHQRQQDQPAVFTEVGIEDGHERILLGRRLARNSAIRVKWIGPLGGPAG